MNVVFGPVVEHGVERDLPEPRQGRLSITDPLERAAVVHKSCKQKRKRGRREVRFDASRAGKRLLIEIIERQNEPLSSV